MEYTKKKNTVCRSAGIILKCNDHSSWSLCSKRALQNVGLEHIIQRTKLSVILRLLSKEITEHFLEKYTNGNESGNGCLSNLLGCFISDLFDPNNANG